MNKFFKNLAWIAAPVAIIVSFPLAMIATLSIRVQLDLLPDLYFQPPSPEWWSSIAVVAGLLVAFMFYSWIKKDELENIRKDAKSIKKDALSSEIALRISRDLVTISNPSFIWRSDKRNVVARIASAIKDKDCPVFDVDFYVSLSIALYKQGFCSQSYEIRSHAAKLFPNKLILKVLALNMRLRIAASKIPKRQSLHFQSLIDDAKELFNESLRCFNDDADRSYYAARSVLFRVYLVNYCSEYSQKMDELLDGAISDLGIENRSDPDFIPSFLFYTIIRKDLSRYTRYLGAWIRCKQRRGLRELQPEDIAAIELSRACFRFLTNGRAPDMSIVEDYEIRYRFHTAAWRIPTGPVFQHLLSTSNGNNTPDELIDMYRIFYDFFGSHDFTYKPIITSSKATAWPDVAIDGILSELVGDSPEKAPRIGD